MPPKAAAIANEGLRPRLSNAHRTAQDVRSLMPTETWNSIDSRYAQIVFLVEFAKIEYDVILDNRTLAHFFQLTAPRIHDIQRKAQTT
jgi:uncharacterized alpha-E superfamily protein